MNKLLWKLSHYRKGVREGERECGCVWREEERVCVCVCVFGEREIKTVKHPLDKKADGVSITFNLLRLNLDIPSRTWSI